MNGQYLTEAELNVHYLNENVKKCTSLQVEVKLVDANGETAGTLNVVDGGVYGLVFP